MADPQPVFEFRGHQSDISCLKFIPVDGRKEQNQILVSGSEDGEIRLWDPSRRRLNAGFVAHAHLISCIGYFSDRFMVSQGREGKVNVWDHSILSNSFENQTIIPPSAAVSPLLSLETGCRSFCNFDIFTDQSNSSRASEGPVRIVSASEDPSELKVWSTGDRREVQSFKPERNHGMCMGVKAIYSSGTPLVVGLFEDSSIYVWDPSHCRDPMFSAQLLAGSGEVTATCFCVDEKLRGRVAGAGDRIKEFKIDPLEGLISQHGEIKLEAAGVSSLSLREDQRIFAASCWDGEIRIYKWKRGDPLALLSHHTKAVRSVEFGRSSLIASSGGDSKIALWKLY